MSQSGDWEGNVWVIPVNGKLLAVFLVIEQCGVILLVGKGWENSGDWEVVGSFRYFGSGWGHYGDWRGVEKFR